MLFLVACRLQRVGADELVQAKMRGKTAGQRVYSYRAALTVVGEIKVSTPALVVVLVSEDATLPYCWVAKGYF